MDTIDYKILPVEKIDLIEPLWKKLKNHHCERASVFKTNFESMTFAERKRRLLMRKKELKIFVVQKRSTSEIVGYCISSISEEGKGEIESIYIDEEYRRSGIGNEFMTRSLEWFDENKIIEIAIAVVLGNEEALPFYEKYGFAPRTYILKKKPI
jgi:ribosomal protein S18 acetylase RimI-like enzyme